MGAEARAAAPGRSRRRTGWRGRRVVAVGLLLLAALGSGVLYLALGAGMWISDDTVIYFAAAENLATGKGLSWLSGRGEAKPMTLFPPLYPILMAGFHRLGWDLAQAARVVNAAAVAALVWLAGWTVWLATGGAWRALLAASFVLTSPILVRQYTRAMTEPTFYVFALLGLFGLWRYLAAGRLRWLVLSGAAVGLAYLTRYAGLSLVLTGLAALLLSRRVRSKRLRGLALFGALAYGPMVVWLYRNYRLTGSTANRSLSWHPPDASVLKVPFAILWQWLFPFEFTLAALWGLALVGGGLAAGCLWLAWRRGVLTRETFLRRLPAEGGIGMLLTLDSLFLAAIILVAFTFLQSLSISRPRISSPIHLWFLLLAAMKGPGLWRWLLGPRARFVPLVLGALLLGSYVYRSGEMLVGLQRYPGGLNVPGWQESRVLTAVRGLAGEVLLYTDDPPALYYYTGQTAYLVPVRYDALSRRERDDYQRSLERMRARLSEGCAALVVFNRDAEGMPGDRGLVEGLRLLMRDGFASVFVHPASPCVWPGVE